MDRIIEMIDKRILELIKEQGSDTIARMEELIKLKDKAVKNDLPKRQSDIKNMGSGQTLGRRTSRH